MKPIRTNDAIKLLEENGFIFIRSNSHMIFGNGEIRIALAHQRTVSPGVARSINRAIKQCKSEIRIAA